MHAKYFAVVAAFASFATSAVAQEDRPRIYFPRHVKRQIVSPSANGNSSTITSAEILPSVDATVPSTTEQQSTTEKRQSGSLSDFLTNILNNGASDNSKTDTSTPLIAINPSKDFSKSQNGAIGSSPGAIVSPTKDKTKGKTTTEEPATSDSDSGILIGPTGIVVIGDSSSSSSASSTSKIADSTPSAVASSTDAPTSDAKSSNVPSQTGGTGASATAPETSAQPTSQDAPSTPVAGASTIAYSSDKSTSTAGGPLPIVSDILNPSKDVNETSATASEQTSAVATRIDVTTTAAPSSTTKGGLLDPLSTLLNSVLPVPTSTSASANASASASATETVSPSSTTKGGLLDPLSTLLNSALPVPTSASANVNATETVSPSSTSAGGILDPISTLLGSVLPAPTSAIVNATETVSPSSTTKGGLLDPISTLLSSILPEPTNANNTGTPEATTSLVILPTSLPIQTPNATLPEQPESTTSQSGSQTETAPNTSVPSSAPTTISDTPVGNSTTATDGQTIPTPTLLPTGTEILITNGTVTTGVPTTAPLSTEIATPTGTAIETSIDNSTAIPDFTSTFQQSTPSASPSQPEETSIVISVPSTSVPAPTTTQKTTKSADPITSIRPTATLTMSNTDDWLPTTIVFEPTSMPTFEPTPAPTTATGPQPLPTNLPKQLLPDNPSQTPPEGSTLIQIGFLFPLNYNFVAMNSQAASQIFKYLPKALADAGGFSQDRVVVNRIVPYDTRQQWGYITALAKVYYPENMLDKLVEDMKLPNSVVYTNDMSLVRSLTSVINRKIDIYGNIDGSGSSQPGPDNGDDNSKNNDAFGNSGTGDQSSKQKATTAGIAVGAFGLSVMYGAAMFIVARRYKRKKQGHQRTSSIGGSSQGSAEMQYARNGSPALMGGALMSRDFSAYGATGGPGPRESHGSGRSGNTARTANISAPVAAENSLGWN